MPKSGKKKNKKQNGKRKKLWAIKVFFVTLIISSFFSITSQKILSTSNNIIFPLFVILIIILIGVVFDIIGIAVTAASDVPFISMSSKKIRGANQALKLIKNADLVSNLCNDVVGDICGIISGAAGSMLILRIAKNGLDLDTLSILISSLIAALTVGGKALGKTIAINKSQQIIWNVGYFLSLFSKNGRRQEVRYKKSYNKKEA